MKSFWDSLPRQNPSFLISDVAVALLSFIQMCRRTDQCKVKWNGTITRNSIDPMVPKSCTDRRDTVRSIISIHWKGFLPPYIPRKGHPAFTGDSCRDDLMDIKEKWPNCTIARCFAKFDLCLPLNELGSQVQSQKDCITQVAMSHIEFEERDCKVVKCRRTNPPKSTRHHPTPRKRWRVPMPGLRDFSGDIQQRIPNAQNHRRIASLLSKQNQWSHGQLVPPSDLDLCKSPKSCWILSVSSWSGFHLHDMVRLELKLW